MIEISIKIIDEKDECGDLEDLILSHVCYSITDESGIKLICPQWDGHSGGDDAYFGLMDRKVKVKVVK